METKVTIEFLDFLPTSINFNEFSFGIKSDDKTFEALVEFKHNTPLSHELLNLRKDTKYTIKALRSGSLIGICEFIIPQLALIKREEVVNKTLTFIMTDNIKRSLFGGNYTNNALKIVVRASIKYPASNSVSVPKDLEKPRVSSFNDNHSAEKRKSNLGNKKPNNRTSIKGQKNNVIKQNYIINPRGSIQVVQDEIKPEEKTKTLVKECSSSFIDELINEENTETPNFVEHVKELDIKLEDASENVTKEQTLNVVNTLFDLQKKYYASFNQSVEMRAKLKSILLKYNDKYRAIIKKQHKLIEHKESNAIKSEVAMILNKEENERVSTVIQLNKSELKVYQSLFGLDYTKQDIDIFNKEQETKSEKKILLKVFNKMINDESVLKSLPENKKEQFNFIIQKYNITKDQTKHSELIFENEGLEKMANDINVESGDLLCSPKKRKLNFVQSKVVDLNDQKLDDCLFDIYTKNEFPNVPIKRISEGNYEYGTQKVQILFEGEEIKVSTGGKCWGIAKFIETQSKIENEKLNKINPKPTTNKGSTRGSNLSKSPVGAKRSLTPTKK